MKKVVIMGASSGMGLKVAEILASRKVHIGVAARNTKPLKELKAKYPKYVEFEEIDVCKPDAPLKLDKLIKSLGGMDIYFHSSGICYENLLLDPEKEAAIINTNSVGFARMLATAYRYFRTNHKKGHIAAISSVAGTNGIGRLAAYSSSKKFAQTYITALDQLSHAEKAGIIFTDIRPGWVRTPLANPDVSYPMEMCVDYAAKEIIYAIAKRKRVWTFDARWRALVAVWKKLPLSAWVRVNVPISFPDMELPKPMTKKELLDSDKANAKLPVNPEGPIKENAAVENNDKP